MPEITVEQDRDMYARMYVASIQRFGRLIDDVVATIGRGGGALDVLEVVGDAANNCDHVDEESVAAWDHAKAVALGQLPPSGTTPRPEEEP